MYNRFCFHSKGFFLWIAVSLQTLYSQTFFFYTLSKLISILFRHALRVLSRCFLFNSFIWYNSEKLEKFPPTQSKREDGHAWSLLGPTEKAFKRHSSLRIHKEVADGSWLHGFLLSWMTFQIKRLLRHRVHIGTKWMSNPRNRKQDFRIVMAYSKLTMDGCVGLELETTCIHVRSHSQPWTRIDTSFKQRVLLAHCPL